MKRKNTTRSALFTSIISLLLCVSMLVGTTFAWFTDSAQSGVNQIVAGNLDVEVYNSLNVGENKVGSNTKLFDEITYWEPGVVAYENLTVANLGTLALKYQLSVNFTDATATPDGKTLANVLKVGFVAGGITSGTREGALAEVNGNWQPLESFIQSGKLDSTKQDLTDAETSDTYGIVIYWEPSDNDNDYNMNNGQTTVLSIDLGIRLVATQLEAESDSYGDDYDEGAWVETMTVATEAELVTALNAAIGKNVLITLENDIKLTGTWTPIGNKDAGEYFTGTLDGNGHTISGLNVGANDYDALISAAKDATIKNLTVEGTVNGVNAAGIVARVEGEIVIENCVSNVAVTGTTKAGGIVSNVTGADAKIINCVNNATVSCSNEAVGGVGGIIGYVNNNAYVEVINCTNKGAVTGSDGKTTGAVIGWAAGTSSGMIAGFTNVGEITGSNYRGQYYNGEPRWIENENGIVLAGYCATYANWTVANAINSAEDLLALGGTQINGTYVLTADIDMSGYDMKPILVASKETLTFIGNGHTISNLKLVASNAYGMTGSGNEVAGLFDMCENSGCSLVVTDLNIANVSIDIDGGYAAAIVGYAQSSSDSIILTNVDVNGANISADSVSALVGYSIGPVTLTDCDVSNITLICEENRPEKVGAYIGTANQATCVVTATNCTNDTAYKYAGRVINGATMTMDSVSYVTNADGLAAAVKNGVTNVLLASGEYDMPNFGQGAVNGVTFIGESNTDTVIKLYNTTSGGDFCLDGSTATLENLKIVTEIKDWAGFQNAKNLTFNKCEFENNLFLTGNATFNYCHFSVETNHYNVWAYTAYSVGSDYTAEFNNCVFDCAGKSIYIDGNPGHTITMKFNGCTFNDNDGGATDKAAIETGTAYGKTTATYNVVIEECVFDADGFAIGKNTDSTIWANKGSMTADKLNITIDGTEIY